MHAEANMYEFIEAGPIRFGGGTRGHPQEGLLRKINALLESLR